MDTFFFFFIKEEVIIEPHCGALVSTSAVIYTTAGRSKKPVTKMKEVY
jgi:hypothetical protein